MILNNRGSNKELFDVVRSIIVDKYSTHFEKENIKAIFIKQLPVSDVVTSNKPKGSSNTTHIACTSQSRNFFYPLLGEIAFKDGLDINSTFDILVESLYLDEQYNQQFVPSKCTIWKFPKEDDQLGLSKKEFDGPEFYNLRSQLYIGDFIIFFKYLDDKNNLTTYVMALKNDKDLDEELIEKIIGSKNPANFAKYYEESVDKFDIELNDGFDSYYIEPNDPKQSIIDKSLKGINKIYYGAPGTGKSKHVNDTYYNKFAKRVTFHPEYTYNDFIGYIRPIVREDGSLTYKFVPGTFTEILAEALENPTNMYSLIIEELNRANTAAVFGDIFQLLDRKPNGMSEYRVNNTDIYSYIKQELGGNYISENGSIYIPNNLNIIATMNTADQNVFVMDTAFKRRWEFEYLPVEFKSTHPFKYNIISKLNVRWVDFVNIINEFMMSRENSSLMISEDKQIGQYFVKEDELNDCNKFGYKVLLYLWDDVFKMDRERIFNKEIRTFSDLITRFSSSEGINIFTSSICEKLKEYIVADSNENEEEEVNA